MLIPNQAAFNCKVVKDRSSYPVRTYCTPNAFLFCHEEEVRQ
jgi:hypothetical protein